MAVVVVMIVPMIVPVIVPVMMVAVFADLLSFDRRLAAAAHRAHHSTSNSATRMSSPDVI